MASGGDYANVSFQSPRYTFEELCEKAYLAGLFAELKRAMGSSFRDTDFIIYSGTNSDETDLSGHDPAKTVVIHISDESSSVPEVLCKRVRAVFKSYLRAEGTPHNLHAFPLGYVDWTPDYAPLAIDARPLNLFFSGNFNRHREELFRILSTPRFLPAPLPLRVASRLNRSKTCDGFFPNSYLRFTDGFGRGMSGEEYARHLVNSKIALCPRGFRSRETFRHFEAMRAGAIVLSERLPPLHCYENSPIVVIDDWRGVRKIVSRLLASPAELAERQATTLAWWRDVCSERATAARIADVLS